MKNENIEYYDRMAKNLYNTAYSDGYGDGLHKGKEEFGQHSRGTAHCARATKEQIESWGRELRDGVTVEKLLRADG